MKDKLLSLLKAGYSGIFIRSHEEERAKLEVAAAANEAGFRLFAWSITTGILDVDNNLALIGDTVGPVDMLTKFGSGQFPEKSILLAMDLHMFLGGDGDPMLVRLIKDTLTEGKVSNKPLLILGCRYQLPPELEKEVSLIEMTLPTRAQLQVSLEGIANASGSATLPAATIDALTLAAAGLTTTEAENAFALSWVERHGFCPEVVNREKCQVIKKAGLLEVIESKEGLDDIGGLDLLKEWMDEVKALFTPEANAYGFRRKPRGIIMVGPSGTGKSLTAKVIRAVLDCILIRMDVGKLKGSLVGQSEQRMRAALDQIEAFGRCVVWIDEVEKALAGIAKGSGVQDGGSSAGQFDALLYKLEEGLPDAFFVLTSNDVSKLPPEFLQRFEDIFFVDLPNPVEREAIWSIQIRQSNRDPAAYDLKAFARLSEGYSGREIRKTWDGAMRKAFAAGAEVGDLHVGLAADGFTPTSRARATEIEALRTWSQANARPANRPHAAAAKTRKFANTN